MKQRIAELFGRLNPIWMRGPVRRNQVHTGKRLACRGRVILHFEPGAEGNVVDIGDDCTLHDVRIRFTGKRSRLVIGRGVRWKGYILVHGDDRTVTIGDETTSMDVYVMCRDADIHIGRGCMFSRGIEVRSSDVHAIYDLETNQQLNRPRDTWIGDRVWIAADATVSKGAYVPDGSVVGAMSFVNARFETPNVVLAGVPARVTRTGVRWTR